MRTEALIHCDPKVAFGEPMVRGARIVDLVDRVAAGDSITDTAEDFGVPVDELVLVLRVVDGAPDIPMWKLNRRRDADTPYVGRETGNVYGERR